MLTRYEWIGSILRQMGSTPIITGVMGWAIGATIIYPPFQQLSGPAENLVNDLYFFLWSLIISFEVGIVAMVTPVLASYVCRLWVHRSRHQTWISTNLIV